VAHVETSVIVNVPISTAYNQWTQFKEFPTFMRGVLSVEQIDERRSRWRAHVAGKLKEWEAEIQEQIPDTRIIWRTTGGTETAGIVRFQARGKGSTIVKVQMSYRPETFGEHVGHRLGFAHRKVESDLRCFRRFIESRGEETGANRETLPNLNVGASAAK
jgi:uncharacterized membrane protein